MARGRRVCKVLTLELRLVLLLILGEQHIVRQASTRHSPLKTHRVALARQAPSTETAVRQRYAALPLNIHGSLRLRALGFGLVLLLLLCIGAFFRAVVNLPLLALLRTLTVNHCTFDS